MSRPIRSLRPGPLAWLALSALAGIAFVLGGGAGVALRAEQWGTLPRRFVDACLLLPQSVAGTSWPWITTHPLTTLVLAFLAASLIWALLRLGLSLWSGWRIKRHLSGYRAGQFPLLDRALRMAPEIDRVRVWLFHSTKPEAFTIGLVRPTICLSVDLLERMTESEVQAVLRHEHAHVTARDPVRLAAVRLLSDFLWFLPVTGVLANTFSGLAEFRADEAAVSAGSDSLELASAIVKTARGASPGPLLAPALGGLPLVEQRVTRLLGQERTIPLPIPWFLSLASGLIITTFLVLLVAPALGTARARALDPYGQLAIMRSMMDQPMVNCARGGDVSMRQRMDRCMGSGSLLPGVGEGGET